ncbi:MAG: ABC transporter substrate-binding protein, partial [Hyphomicrobiales bacterium]|nr:ABC transporter substrate-binding protein [Hyphomicrobiales bacterium]
MQTRRTFLAASAAGAMTTALSSRGALGQTGSSVEVAAILPFSGNLEIFGTQARVGLDLAQSEINQTGGIMGRPLHLRYEDNRSDPGRGAALVGEVAGDGKPLAIVGPISSAVRDAMMPEIVSRQIPLLYATNYEGGVCSRYFFCFNTVPNQETGRMLPYLNANFGNRYFMLGSDYVWPRKMFETAQAIIAKLGGETVGIRFEPLGTSAFTDAV